MGQAADPVDGRADLRLAGQVPPPEQGPREERPVVGIVHQAGHDPVDVSPASPLRCGRRIPLSRCSLNRPYGTVTQLSQNQQFQDAQTWFHYIFNPTISSNDPIPQRYWRFLPFYECSPWDEVEGQIQNLFKPPPSGVPSLCGQDTQDQINAWQANPFDPFLIGRMRTIAFRMKVVMAYLDNLIAWGDSLFGQNTRESINEATQIYVLAKDILGPRPVQIPQRGVSQDYTYNDLKTLYGSDDFSNPLVQMENDFPYLSVSSAASSSALGTALSMSNVVPYFCFSPNNTLLGYWDTVDDRLYKI